MDMNKKSFWGWVVYGVMGLIYCYAYSSIPFQITSIWVGVLLALSLLITPFMIGFSFAEVLPEQHQENKTLGCIVPLAILIFTVHHLVFLVLIAVGDGYEDKEVYYPDALNKRRQIITQHIDQGAIGEHYRTIKVYELTPFLRYVEQVEYPYDK